MKTGIYIRVSTQEQALEGFSLAAQTARLRAYCESQDWSVVDIYADEGISAKDTVRPQLQRMIADLKGRKLDVVLVYKLDRLTRSVSDLYELLRLFDKHNVGFKSATEIFDTTTAMGRLFITMVAAMAQWERETIGERVGVGQDQKALEGRRVTGTAPFGYIKEGDSLFIHEAQAQVVRELFERYIRGEGIHRLRRWLLQRYPREGSKWDSHTISYMLENPVYIGKIRWNYRSSRANAELIITDGEHKAIISTETWERAQSVRQKRSHYAPRSGTGRFPFAGLIYCARCGATMQGHYGGKYAYYRCSKAILKQCDARLMRSDILTDKVARTLDTLSHPSLLECTPLHRLEAPRTKQRQTNVLRAKASIAKRKHRLWDAYELGSIELHELQTRLDHIEEEERMLAAIQEEESGEMLACAHRDRERVKRTALKDFYQGFMSLSLLEQKELLRALLDRVDIDTLEGAVSITLKQM